MEEKWKSCSFTVSLMIFFTVMPPLMVDMSSVEELGEDRTERYTVCPDAFYPLGSYSTAALNVPSCCRKAGTILKRKWYIQTYWFFFLLLWNHNTQKMWNWLQGNVKRRCLSFIKWYDTLHLYTSWAPPNYIVCVKIDKNGIHLVWWGKRHTPPAVGCFCNENERKCGNLLKFHGRAI